MKKFLSIIGSALLVIVIGVAIYLLADNGITDLESLHSKIADFAAKSVSVNETIEDSNNVQFTVTEVENKSSIGEDSLWATTTDNNFMIIKIKICNTGNEAYDVNSANFLLTIDGQEYEGDPSYLAGVTEYGDDYMFLDTVNPGIEKEYYTVFETPIISDKHSCKLKIVDNIFIKDEILYIELQ